MRRGSYVTPTVITYNTVRLREVMGPAQAQSGTLDVQIGAVAYNNSAEVKYFDLTQEYRIVQLKDKQAKLA